MKQKFAPVLARGYTLIELAIALAVTGIVIVMVWRFGVLTSQRIVEMETPPALVAADDAVAGFAAANNRLPCPDTTGNGQEDCGGALTGKLPVVTLGLARADLANLRYGVFRAAHTDPRLDADLAVAKDRLAPMIATGHPAAALSPSTLLLQTNGIDLCEALRLGGALGADSAKLNIRNAGGTMIKNVAYALALPGGRDADGDGNLFDGANAVAGAFAAPGQPVGAAYDDTVLAIDFSQMFSRMSCAGALAAASHAHANAASSAAILYSGFLDYKVQLQLADEMAQAKISSATAATFSAGAGVAKAGATVAIAVAQTLLSLGAASPTLATSATAVAFNAAALALGGAAVDRAVAAKAVSEQRIADFAPILSDAQTLSTSILTHAVGADAAGLY